MQFFVDILVIVVMTYISVTNQLAFHIVSWLGEPQETVTHSTTGPVPTPTNLQPLATETPTIPDILLRSTAYQQAALSSAAMVRSATTADPLEALVNIYCTFTTDTYIRTTTGTGFFVSADGVILTNAHVAQYLLLASADDAGQAECSIRTGNPAEASYRANLLYIPPAWITRNAALIDDPTPMGTGERDYALLYVTESMTSTPLPARFPALAFDSRPLALSTVGSQVVAAGYPAANLRTTGNSLTPTRAATQITELYTFGSNLADVFSIGGTPVGAEGASGGPVVDPSGAVIGLIVTRGDDSSDGAGSLRAITLSHIDRTITEETGFSLERNIGGNLPFRAEVFRTTMTPFLLTLLEQERRRP